MDAAIADLFRRAFFYMAGQSPTRIEPAEVAYVFGRKDRRVAETVAKLYKSGMVSKILITGGVGKDSGDLAAMGLTEAQWLAGILLVEFAIPREDIYIEMQATNGGENCRFGLDLLAEKGVKFGSVTVVAHATSLRRLATQLGDELAYRGLDVTLQRVPTSYPFDEHEERDRREVVDEITRLVDWPHKHNDNGWPFLSSQPADDAVPEDLRNLSCFVKEPIETT